MYFFLCEMKVFIIRLIEVLKMKRQVSTPPPCHELEKGAEISGLNLLFFIPL